MPDQTNEEENEEMDLAIIALLGTILTAVAYLPQITHLIREHCAYGISSRAWLLWLIASFLILPYAVSTGDLVFIALQLVNESAILFILVFARHHQGKVCKRHQFL